MSLENRKKSLAATALWELAFLGFLIAADLITKQLVFAFLETQPGNSVVIFDKIFTFVMAYNDGASFGIFAGQQLLLTVFTGIITGGVLLFLIWKPHSDLLLRVSLLLIAGGAIGNLVDRAWLGVVRDFIDYTFLNTFFGIDFAIGNVADVFLCVGVVALVVYVFAEACESDLYAEKEKKERKKI